VIIDGGIAERPDQGVGDFLNRFFHL
jgi:hypothetical protein